MSETREARLKDAAEMLWVVLVNVNGGDWTKQTQEWQEAAARWRDNYLAVMREFPPHKEGCTPPEAPPEPPTPTLQTLAAGLGWGNSMTDEAIVQVVLERERLLGLAQELLETHKSAAWTAEDALHERIAALRGEPPTPEPDVCDPEMRVQVPTRTVKGYRPRSTPEPERPDPNWFQRQAARVEADRASLPEWLKEPERPAARCVWREVAYRHVAPSCPEGSTDGATAFHVTEAQHFRVCPYCTTPLSVEDI